VPDYSETERRLRARIGGLSLHLRHDSDEIAKEARAGFDARFYNEALEIDPTLEGKALEKKDQILRSIYFSRLAPKSLKPRKKKNRQNNSDKQAVEEE
jgi:hypothetical protein